MMNSNDETKNQETDMNQNQRKEHRGHHCHGGGRMKWKIPFIIAAVLLVKSALVLLLWNALIPEVFHGPELTYLQALELTVLVKILTGFGGGFRHRFGHHHHHRGGSWGQRWMQMSREERIKMREEMRNRCRK